MIYEVLLFIGGPADGERREVARGIRLWTVNLASSKKLMPACGPHDVTPVHFEAAVYQRSSFRDSDGEFYDVMLHDSAMNDPIRHLIEGYRKEVST